MARKDELDAHIANTDDPHGTTAGQVTVTPTGDIAATNVQDAIAELDSEKQPLDALLTALAALTTAANQLIYSTGSDTVSMTSLTAYARTLLDDADATTARATLDAEQAGTAAAAISTHEGEADPHPVYLTAGEVVAETLSDLQSLDVSGFSGDEVRYMAGRTATGDGGEGDFVFRSGDKSTEVAGDPLSGIWVAPASDATGASGAWERSVTQAEIVPELWGAAADGTADDSDAYHAAMDYVKENRATLSWSAKTYRIVTGYEHDVADRDVRMVGKGSSRVSGAGAKGTVILLDNADAESYFYKSTMRHRLSVQGITFRSAQEVKDRRFFYFYSGMCVFDYEDINFENVEKPLVFREGSYTQSCSLRNVQFSYSGTIHTELDGLSATPYLVGTLLRLDNVNHENSTPDNSEKIVMDLSGFREIQHTNLLLEGTVPATGWTALRLEDRHDADWTRHPFCNIDGLHIEFAGAYPLDHTIHQSGGHVSITHGSYLSTASPCKLDNFAHLTINQLTFSASWDAVDDYFEIEDERCKVHLINSTTRGGIEGRNITAVGCTYNDSTYPTLSGSTFYKIFNTPAYEFNGGYITSPATPTLGSGTTYYPSTDATYGRKLVVVPNGDNVFINITIPMPAPITQEDTLSISVLAQMPTWSSGTGMRFGLLDNTTVIANLKIGASGELVELNTVVSLSEITSTTVGLNISGLVLSGVAGNMEIYSLRLSYGNQLYQHAYKSFPDRIVTENSAAPTAGTWVVGDRVYDTAPASAGNIGFVCTTAGTPGTWKTFGVIA